MENIIHYGFGKDYLKNWGIQEALREIYQNFLDFGDYTEESFLDEESETVTVMLSNEWVPESLDFLRIGNSRKGDGVHIGKHGEGLKMAFLILLREGYISYIYTSKYMVFPEFYIDSEIGEIFCLRYRLHGNENQKFLISFTCKSTDFKEFKDNLIFKKDIIFSDGYYGDIVDKPAGSIYSGNLFICKVNNLSRSYNINPSHISLDRDRKVPPAFDVNWATSKILEKYGKWTTKDLTYSDTTFITNIPQEVKEEFKPKKVGNDIQFIFKDENGKDKILSNPDIKNSLKKDSFFTDAIKKIKMFLAKQLGLYDLLIQFKEKHVHSADAIADFDLILERVNK